MDCSGEPSQVARRCGLPLFCRVKIVDRLGVAVKLGSKFESFLRSRYDSTRQAAQRPRFLHIRHGSTPPTIMLFQLHVGAVLSVQNNSLQSTALYCVMQYHIRAGMYLAHTARFSFRPPAGAKIPTGYHLPTPKFVRGSSHRVNDFKRPQCP